MGLRSIAGRLARRLLPSRRKASRSPDPSRSSRNDSSSTLDPSSLGSEGVHARPSLTPLRPPLISLLEVPPFGGKDPSFIPLLVYPLRACFESDTRILAMSKLDNTSAAQLAEIIQAVCDIFHRIYTHFNFGRSASTYQHTQLGQLGRPSSDFCSSFAPPTHCCLGASC